MYKYLWTLTKTFCDKIIFANPCKMSSQIKYARANDVDMMTFDCEEELYKIKRKTII